MNAKKGDNSAESESEIRPDLAPVWMTDEKLNASDSETDHDEELNEDDDDGYIGSTKPNKKLKTSHSTSRCGPGRASSLTSNAVYAYDASQAHDTQDNDDAGLATSANDSVPASTQMNDDKRHRQIQLQKHSVVFSKSNSGPTASYMGICRLPYDEASTGTRREHRHRRIDLKTYPRSYLPFAMLYFTGQWLLCYCATVSSVS